MFWTSHVRKFLSRAVFFRRIRVKILLKATMLIATTAAAAAATATTLGIAHREGGKRSPNVTHSKRREKSGRKKEMRDKIDRSRIE
jgi:hypothetical protein